MFQHVITTEAQLRDLMGQASEGAIKKETDYLTDECIAYIARSPFMLLATSSKDGRCDVSPKGDPNGFVKVLDSRHIVENPRIGLIFLVPGRHETLRVNGRASITNDPDLLDSMTVHGKRPWFAIGVEVEECFLHCGKAFLRSQLWEPASWPDLATVPSGGALLSGTRRGDGMSVEEIDKGLAAAYKTTLY
jgi:uncharacterized protein